MLRVGLTGGFGSGKSTVAAMFAKGGAAIIDADLITKHILEKNKKCIKKVAKTFPDAILKPVQEVIGIDRKRLANHVFKNPRELKKLTDIIYPEAIKEVKRLIIKYKKKPLVVLDVPLLFEAGWDRYCDTTIVVRVTAQEQISRIKQRMPISTAEIKRRLKLQMPQPQKCLLADIIIDNSGTLANTRGQVDAIIHRLLNRKH